MSTSKKTLNYIDLFFKILNSSKNITKKYEKIVKVKPFDVTLRDGIQALTPKQQEVFTTNYKISVYNDLVNNYQPIDLEVGSLVNTKMLPIFKDTEELFTYIEKNNKLRNHYVLIPNQEKLLNALKVGVTHFSFVTSVSNRFQFKNTKMLLTENFMNLNEMFNILDDYYNQQDKNNTKYNYKVKLYVSCINECPLVGKIPLQKIINELHILNLLKFDKICLADTCGTLTNDEFIEIIDSLINEVKIDINNISLHLHIKPDSENTVEQIVHTAIDYGIKEFDVSDLNTGGCSITMDNNKLAPNMNYEQYFRFLTNYLLK
jgi:isopropylmalate/homocitrate/citramalate synthase